MKSIFKNIPVLLVAVLACLLLVLYKASQYLNQQQEKARIQATITDPEDTTLNNYYHPVSDSLAEANAENQNTKFVDEDEPKEKQQPLAEEELPTKTIAPSKPITNNPNPSTKDLPKSRDPKDQQPKTNNQQQKTKFLPNNRDPKDQQPTAKDQRPKTNPDPSGPKTNNQTKAEDTGNYYVIAGSFSNKNNANAKLKEVKDKGFSNAKLVTFKSLKLISVSLRTYPTEAQANAYAKQVKEKYDITTVVKRGTKKVK